MAKETKALISKTEVGLDEARGLDHGVWSVIKNLYADVPVIQMSLDYNLTPQSHYELARELKSLREKVVLVIGSGNMVHNLRILAWDKLNAPEFGFDWAIEANAEMKKSILDGEHKPLIDFRLRGNVFDLAIPTLEHFLPLLYALALIEEKDKINFFNDKVIAGSLATTSVKIG